MFIAASNNYNNQTEWIQKCREKNKKTKRKKSNWVQINKFHTVIMAFAWFCLRMLARGTCIYPFLLNWYTTTKIKMKRLQLFCFFLLILIFISFRFYAKKDGINTDSLCELWVYLHLLLYMSATQSILLISKKKKIMIIIIKKSSIIKKWILNQKAQIST